MLASFVRPLRISLPMTTMQAVTIFAGATEASDMQALVFFGFSAPYWTEPERPSEPTRSCYGPYRMPNRGHEQPPRYRGRQRRLLAARRAHDQASRRRRIRRHAP